MSVDTHRHAEVLMERADIAEGLGRPADAIALRRQAADLEDGVFWDVPASRLRTRGIIAFSAVSLYLKAGELD